MDIYEGINSGRPIAAGGGFGVAHRDGGGAAIDTGLTTGVAVAVNLSDMAIPNAAAENGVTHEGNGQFTVDAAGTYTYTWNGAIFHTGISGSVSVNFTYGIWNGASFDDVPASAIAESLDIRTRTVDATGALYATFTFSGIALSAGDRIGLMVNRTGGVSQNMRCRAVTCAIYKE